MITGVGVIILSMMVIWYPFVAGRILVQLCGVIGVIYGVVIIGFVITQMIDGEGISTKDGNGSTHDPGNAEARQTGTRETDT